MLQNLFTKSKAFDPALQQFLSVDRGSIEKELDLKRRAKEDGKINIPKSNATTKDAIATDIDVYMMDVLCRGKDELQDHLHAIGVLNTVQTIDQQITELKINTLEALTRFYTTCKNGVNDIFSKKQIVGDGELAYENFRTKNNLDRPGHYPENRFREFWWIILALVLEAMFNSWALGTAHPEGPLGVFLETVFIATVNILIGVVIGGYFWRQTNHINKARAFFGYVVATAFATFMFVFNFVIGHYRDSLIGLQTQVANADIMSFYEAYGNLFRTTIEKALSDTFWAFGGLMSLLLMIIGIAMSVFAAIKAFALDDPYPGYGSVSRARDKRNADYADLFSYIQEELQNIGKNANTNIANIFEVAQISQGMRKDREKTLKVLMSKYDAWIAGLKTVGTALYANYRQTNVQHRTDESDPPAFKIDFSILDDAATPPEWPKLTEGQGMGHLRKLKDECLTIVNQASNRYLGIYKTIGGLAPENVKARRADTYDIEVEKVNAELQKLVKTGGITDRKKTV